MSKSKLILPQTPTPGAVWAEVAPAAIERRIRIAAARMDRLGIEKTVRGLLIELQQYGNAPSIGLINLTLNRIELRGREYVFEENDLHG